MGDPASWSDDERWTRVFGLAARAMLPELTELLGELRPGVVVRESGDGVGVFAAAAADVPCAALGIMHRKPNG